MVYTCPLKFKGDTILADLDQPIQDGITGCLRSLSSGLSDFVAFSAANAALRNWLQVMFIISRLSSESGTSTGLSFF